MNIHKYLWYIYIYKSNIIRNTEHRPNGAASKRPPHGGRRRRQRLCVLCFWLFYTIHIYGYSLYIPVYSCIYSLNIPYIFPSYCPYVFPWVYLHLSLQQYAPAAGPGPTKGQRKHWKGIIGILLLDPVFLLYVSILFNCLILCFGGEGV